MQRATASQAGSSSTQAQRPRNFSACTAMLVVHSCAGPHLLAQSSCLKFGLTLLEWLRIVLHSATGPTVSRCEPCHCDETDCENEDPGDGSSLRRANSGGQAVVTSDEFGSVDREVCLSRGAERFLWRAHLELARHGAGGLLVFLVAMCGWTVFFAGCLRPKPESLQ